jgi:DNA-binding PadR family transcriptional regulator
MRGGFGRGEGRRANRGDIRAAILALLAEEPMHGYQMIQELGTRSNGAWTPSPGSIYPALQLLQDEGLISAAETDGKRVFTLTAAGRDAVAERGDKPLPWDAAARGEKSGFGELRQLVMQVANAVHQVASVGDESQLAKAVTVMTNTRRELYRILAEDDTATAE